MTQQRDDYKYKVDEGFSGWRTNVTLPYSLAYDTAFESFGKVVKEQADADKARAELFITAASIVTGSVLMRP